MHTYVQKKNKWRVDLKIALNKIKTCEFYAQCFAAILRQNTKLIDSIAHQN